MLQYALSTIHTKGKNLDVSNYRPVSILSGVSKIFEKEIVNQMSVYLEKVVRTHMDYLGKT
jgi:hypothetical protein